LTEASSVRRPAARPSASPGRRGGPPPANSRTCRPPARRPRDPAGTGAVTGRKTGVPSRLADLE
jgi:hypothetical protein